jgi:hypothetical protein
MKSNNALIVLALLCLMLATVASVTLWGDISSPVKIGMFAFGFGAGTTVATLIARRTQ